MKNRFQVIGVALMVIMVMGINAFAQGNNNGGFRVLCGLVARDS